MRIPAHAGPVMRDNSATVRPLFDEGVGRGLADMLWSIFSMNEKRRRFLAIFISPILKEMIYDEHFDSRDPKTIRH